MPSYRSYLSLLPLVLSASISAQAKAPSRPTKNALPGFVPYRMEIPGTGVFFEMVPIRGGRFRIGSPEGEQGRKEDEGPMREVEIAPFWMGKFEVTWNEFELWSMDLDRKRRKVEKRKKKPGDEAADAVTRPSKPYVDMSFGMGKDGFPVICITQLAAKTYCAWLSAKTGQTYRLPTEAEWEYACRAGTQTPWSFGGEESRLGDYAWFEGNSEERYHKVGLKKPNPWGLHDMHGNVSEWVLDGYDPRAYAKWPEGVLRNPFTAPKGEYPRSVRGGSWMDEPAALRSAARRGSDSSWKMLDPQIPQSRWYHTSAPFVGFRILRPYMLPRNSGGRPASRKEKEVREGGKRALK